MIYLDTSALVKLICEETETAALADWLDERPDTPWATSVLAEVELIRAVRASSLDDLPAIPALLARLIRLEMDAAVRATAAAYPDPNLRSLDAIHLASAHIVGSYARLTALVTYDKRMMAAATSVDIPVVAPGAADAD